jgi:hypothetical protein
MFPYLSGQFMIDFMKGLTARKSIWIQFEEFSEIMRFLAV